MGKEVLAELSHKTKIEGIEEPVELTFASVAMQLNV